jgi:hypothetical protein
MIFLYLRLVITPLVFVNSSYNFIVLDHELTYLIKHKTKGATQKMKSSVCWSSLSITYQRVNILNKSSASVMDSAKNNCQQQNIKNS